MKLIIPLLILTIAQSTHAMDSYDVKPFTPSVVVDGRSSGAKGAVQLVWQRGELGAQYEIQVSNGESVYSDVSHRNFKHVMLYFGKDYQWRVRKVSREKESSYSQWFPVKVLNKKNYAQSQSASHYSQRGEVESLFVDHGE